jgi:hypothetical protein
LAQHAFDVLASLRCQATTGGVASFLTAAHAASKEAKAASEVAGAAGTQSPVSTSESAVSDIVSETSA